MTQEVQRDVAQSYIFFHLRGAGNPPAQALRQHEGIVTQDEGVPCHVFRCLGPGLCHVFRRDGIALRLFGRGIGNSKRAHRCGTPSLFS